jgi:ABC-2 type transport system permease protein
MSTELALIDMRMRRRSLLGFAFGMAVYALVIVALYPTFKDDHSLDRFTEKSSTVAALFGANGPLTTPSGWLNANLYGNFVPLVVLLLTIGYGAHAIAGQDEDGTLGLVTSLPVSRRSVVLQKFATMCVQAVPVSVVTLLCVVAGRGFDLHLTTGALVGITVGCVLLGIDFGALALLIGAASGSRGVALGITSSIAAASYLVSSLAPVVDWIRPARYVSLFYWSVGNGQLTHGIGGTSIAVLAAAAAALAAAAVVAFARLDVH